MAGGRRRRIHFSKIYNFSCIRSSFRDDHSQIGQKGYSRIVHCNDPDNPEAAALNYCGNYVSTTKYTLVNFIPKSLFEQFRRVANVYFLVVAFVSFSPLAPYRAVSVLLPLLVVIGATMAKEAVEDWRRKKQDIEVNNRKTKVYGKDHTFHETTWKELRVGDLVRVDKDEFFPADLLLLSSSNDDGICYVETMNLDGETNLKVKQSLEVTLALRDEKSFQHFKASIKCEDPNESLYSFVGSLYYDGNQYPLSPHQILLRDSKLRNTQYIYGVVIFTGHDTKVMRNATDPPSKRSTIERRMDKIIYLLFSILVLISSVGSVLFGIKTKEDISDGKFKRWYLRPDDSTIFFDPRRAAWAGFFHFLTGLMLYGYLIPISLYVSIEIVKVLQSIFINQDLDMYDEEMDRPARARTSNLNEELGQVDTILSDKTGTLTCNSMEFLKCSIAGISYGRGMTEVERAMARRFKHDGPEFQDLSSDFAGDSGDVLDSRPRIKGFNFRDERIMNGQWVKEPKSDAIQKFFRVLAICHTAIPEVDEESGEISYEAESPDEAAFVIAAREVGFEFYERTQTSISLHELDPKACRKVDRSYKLLQVLEFSSSRKRMSVIVRNEEGQLLLLCKGADSVMFERLAEDGRMFESRTKEHVNEYAEAGLRTLVIAYRELGEEEYNIWQEEFVNAKNSVSADRDAMMNAAADKIERDLILLGATAVEDKLQKGVPECIDKLAQAGIKIWVLTGDKMETAINIGFACSLLRQGMKQIVITLDAPDINALEKQGDKEAVAKASRESITKQIREAKSQVSSAKESSVASALIIDGKSLDFALVGKTENLFLELAIDCASVICCRSSPKQKALVTRLVKKGTGKTTLAIGDGANDVGMLLEADVGVGISGVEGMQICYFFYKNMTFGFTLVCFEAYASFSGQPAYNDWYLSFYNVFFTSLPVIALGIFDQDVPARLCLQFPLLHQEGVQNILFRWYRILGWMFNGVCSSIIIFFFATSSVLHQAFRQDGRVAGYEALGVTMYTCVVWTVNCQLALSLSYFTWIHHFVIWGSIIFWYIFLTIYGTVPPTISTSAYKVLVEVCSPSPLYWLSTLFIVVSALLPYFSFVALQSRFFPTYHSRIQAMHAKGSVPQALVGFSARFDARMKERVHRRQS
ncbi:probable phospholipid-transporting ATPase 8 isoform X2 [Magnolia sinica]|uniref:probable phospholipid-transporting ATPase 8 isoform X2 n=1 Tax=Magnolia sinica TaxID=86752 RepID=UPI00265AA639|nr:probable phospholipid-transporting ATPase 8 isoform X2 [Magnolia sinica]